VLLAFSGGVGGLLLRRSFMRLCILSTSISDLCYSLVHL
jgi:hypothetical protein